MGRLASRRLALAATCLLASAVLLVGADKGSPGGDKLARRVESVVRAQHLSPRQVDPARVTRMVRNELAGHPALAARMDDVIDAFVEQVLFDFAPLGAVPDRGALYRLPYDARIPRLCSLGVDGKPTHTGADRYAWDFVMPRGTPVLAARSGVVARVIDGFTRGAKIPSMMRKDNIVLVLHSDGTYAMYAHLSPGIHVREGQRVKAGDVLARSGSTGYASGPHLHFEVLHTRADRYRESVPIRFTVGSGEPFVPKLWNYYGHLPRPTVRMRIFARGAPVRPKDLVSLADGAVLPLRVEVLEAGGARDVTADPRLRLVVMTPWNLALDGPGRVAARPTAGYEHSAGLPTAGAVLVYYGLDDGPELGIGQIGLSLAP